MKRSFFAIAVSALVAWAAFAFILYYLPPTTANGKIVVKTVSIFLGTLGLAIAFSSSLFFYLLHRTFGQVESPRMAFRKSLREGFLTGLGIGGIGLLALLDVLTILNAGLLVATLVLLEIYFLTRSQEKNQ